MNEELTNDWIEGALNTARQVTIMGSSTVERLATALLEERAKPKVWDGAPDEAGRAAVTFYGNGKLCGTREYTRELPKTRARQIAENLVHGLTGVTNNETKDIEYVECVLNKYVEELTNTKETD